MLSLIGLGCSVNFLCPNLIYNAPVRQGAFLRIWRISVNQDLTLSTINVPA